MFAIKFLKFRLEHNLVCGGYEFYAGPVRRTQTHTHTLLRRVYVRLQACMYRSRGNIDIYLLIYSMEQSPS